MVEDEENGFWPIVFDDKKEKNLPALDKDGNEVTQKFILDTPIEASDFCDGYRGFYEKLNAIKSTIAPLTVPSNPTSDTPTEATSFADTAVA